MSPAPEPAELLDTLSKLISGFRQDGSKATIHWADWLEKAHDEIASRDFHGVERLLRAYGGMGSINDILATPEQGRLLEQAWELANALKREYQT